MSTRVVCKNTLPWLLRAVTDQHQREEVTDGLRAAIRLHLEDYEDATDVDPGFLEALEKIAEYSDVEVFDLVDQVKRDLADETGREFDHAED